MELLEDLGYAAKRVAMRSALAILAEDEFAADSSSPTSSCPA